MELRHDRSVMSRRALLTAALVAAAAVVAALLLSSARADRPPNADEQLAVFAGPGDAVPADVAEQFGNLTGDGSDTGRPATAKVRAMRSNPDGSTLYALPTTKGEICFLLAKGGVAGPSTCVDRFRRDDRGAPIAPIAYYKQGEGMTVVGLAPPNVAAVDVVLAGGTVETSLAHHVFFFHDTTLGEDDVRALTVRFKDGTTFTRQL